MMKFVCIAVLVASVGLLACSSDSTNTSGVADGGVDSGTPTNSDAGGEVGDAGHAHDDAGNDAGNDAGVVAVRCTKADFDAHDHTGTNGVDITFPNDGIPAQYTENCARVKVGQHVGFYGAFGSHPLQPFGGDTPSFIPDKNSGDTLDLVAPTAPGVFGFQCQFHPSTMFGAVEVVP